MGRLLDPYRSNVNGSCYVLVVDKLEGTWPVIALCRATYAGHPSGFTMGEGRLPWKISSHCLAEFSDMLYIA